MIARTDTFTLWTKQMMRYCLFDIPVLQKFWQAWGHWNSSKILHFCHVVPALLEIIYSPGRSNRNKACITLQQFFLLWCFSGILLIPTDASLLSHKLLLTSAFCCCCVNHQKPFRNKTGASSYAKIHENAKWSSFANCPPPAHILASSHVQQTIYLGCLFARCWRWKCEDKHPCWAGLIWEPTSLMCCLKGRGLFGERKGAHLNSCCACRMNGCLTFLK